MTKPKRCTACKEFKPRSAFGKHKKMSDGLRLTCKPCTVKLTQDYRKRTKGHWIRAKYGLSLDDYDTIFEIQDGKCGICAERAPLVIDHCHKSGHIRGLLCHGCNVGIGFLKDSPDRLELAAAYLRKCQSMPSLVMTA